MKTIFADSMQGISFRMFNGGCLVLCILLTVAGAAAVESDGRILLEEDCVKCHWFQQKTITDAGGKHATEIGCLDCHPRHPPEEEKSVASCAACHADQPHFRIEDCRQCHADPHKPLVSLRDPVKPVRMECLSCHAGVGQQMTVAGGIHAELYCTRCHSRHGFIPSCLDCHKPHLAIQADDDCLQCHPAHQPLQVLPTGWVPAEYCQVCHSEEGRNLAATRTLHGGVNCVYCHKGQHPDIPGCQDCHGLPHDQMLHSKFRRCLSDCHGDAHALLSNS